MFAQARRLGSALAVTFALAASACHNWQPAELTPAQINGAGGPHALRVTRRDGEHVVLNAPRLVHDSLGGFVGDRQVMVPLSDVRSLAILRPSVDKDIGVVALIVIGFMVALGISMALAGGGICCGS